MQRSTGSASWIPRPRMLAGLVACVLPLVPLCGLPLRGAGRPEAQDPLPLRRVPINVDRLAEEMSKVRQGVLAQMTRVEFEEKVRRAAPAASIPQLVEARYRARLAEGALTGSAEWRILHEGPVPAVLPLDPLNLAVSKPRFENRDGVVGEFSGARLGLLVDEPGIHSVALDWTARGDPTPAGLRFKLETPACALATLELDLPADRAVKVETGDCQLSGPHASEAPERRRWKIGFAGQSELFLTIRPADGPDRPPPLVLATLRSRMDLDPGLLRAEFRFDLEVLHRGLHEVTCLCDPALRVTRVAVPRLESWKVKPGEAGAPDVLTVKLREPLEEGTLQVFGHAAVHAGVWSAPGIRLVNAVPRGEKLALHLHPDVRLEDWQANGFRLTDASPRPDGGRVLNLTDTGFRPADAAGPVRPSARVVVPHGDFRARPVVWWQAGPGTSALTAQVRYEPLHGRLFALPLALPPEWVVDHVELQPAKLLREWSVRQEDGHALLIVLLNDALAPPFAARLRVTLHPTVRPAAGGEWPLPDMSVPGAHWREGVLAVSWDQQGYQAFLNTPTATSPAREEGPWGKQTPDVFLSYGASGLQGRLQLRPLPARVTARCHSEVIVTGGGLAVEGRVEVRAEGGLPEVFEVETTAPLAGPGTWKPAEGGPTVRRLERLETVEAVAPLRVLATTHALAAAAGIGAGPVRPRWRVTLANPLRPSELLTLHFTGAGRPPAGTGPWEAPLLVVRGADRIEGEATLHLTGGDRVRMETEGLTEPPAATAGARPRAAFPWRAFRYDGPDPALRLFGLTTSATRPVDAEAPQAVLTSWIRPGERWHHFRFRVTNWRQQTLPVRLPADARLTALRVDGRWVDRPVSGTDSPLTSADDTGVRTVDLPVPSAASPGLHEFELVYIQPSATWCLWDWLESAAPVLPVEPTVFRHRWRLPAGVVPLGADSRPTGSVAKLFDPLPALPTWQTDGDGVRGQQLAMETAAQRALTAKPTTLGELIERLALALPADQGPLIVDAAALQEAGLDRATPIPSSAEPLKPWKAVGLVHVPCLGAPLLTTERQAASPDGAMQLAARAGHDPAGRFRQALDWLRGDPDGEPLASPAGLVAEALEPDWGEWPEPVGAASGFMVVRQTPVTAAGVLLACGALLLAWLTRQASSGRRLAWLAAWLTMAALGVLWLPYALRPVAAWPLGAGLLTTVVLHLRLLLTKGARAAQPVSQAAAAALGFVALGISGLTGAPPVVPPAPATTVFLVPAVGGASDRETVLVPPALLTRLDALARTATDAPRGITVTAATYEGKAVDGAVEVDGLLQTFSFEDGPAVLALPLGGISLQGEVLVDGARAYPTALTAPQTGYQLKVEGRGPHVVRLHFRVPVQAAGAERDLQFTAPRPAQCRLTLRLPEGATHVSVLTRLGAQQVEGSTQGPLLQVDLGRAAAPIHARWRHDPPGSTPVVQTREAFFWQIRPGTSSLAALFEYTVTAGAVADLELDLPETLDVRNVEVRTASGQSPRLRDWQASGSGLDRRLRLEFQTPLSAPVVVRLDLVPRRALDATAELPFPTPRGAHAIRSAIAFRREGVEAQVNDLAHLTAIPPTDFTRFWKALGGDDPGTLAGAYAFTRRADAVPRLQLRLHAPLTIAEAAQDVVWHVDRHRTEFQATVRLTPEGGELVLAEWDVPPAVVVSRVTGRAVRQWSRSGPHLQVWLQGAEAPADIDLFGWVEGEEGSRGKPEPEARPFTFDVPAVVVRAARSQMTTVRVAAEPGLVLEPVQVQNLLALPDPRLSDGERCYVSHQAGYGGRFRLRAAGLPVVTRQLAFAELRGGRLVVTMIADCQVTRGEPKVLHVRLPDWRGDAQLDAVGALAVRRQESGWEIEFASGFSGTCRLTVTATVAREGAAGGVALPHLQVEGASKVEQWVAIDARELGAEGPRALDPVGAAADWPATWPGAADRVRRAGGQAWKAPSADWTLRVVPRPAAAPTASGQVAFTEQEAAVLDGHRWLHQATCWLYHEANTDLGVILPAGSAAVAATLDGEPVPAFQPGSDRLWLPLTGTNGVRVLRLRWQFDAGREALNHPLLERPRFDGLTEGPTLWSLHVPPGWSVSPEPVALSRAHQDLVRADARLRLSALLAGPVRAGDPPGLTLDALQQQFYRLCRLAQLDRSGVDGESTSDVAARLQNLRSRNADLARRLGFDAERAEAERQAGDHLTGRGTELPSLTDQGAMVAWTGEAGESVPQPRVTADASQGRTVAWLATAGILAALVLVWFVARLPDVEKWVRASWPEQVMLVGFLAWLTPLPPTLPAVLVLVGGAARFFAAGAWLRAGWERRAAVPLSAERPPAPG